MDAIREQLNKPLVAGLIGLVIGLIIGLPILGWWLWPVQWYDASAENLRPDLQEEWLSMSIMSYQVDQDATKAQWHWVELGEAADDTLQRCWRTRHLESAGDRRLSDGGDQRRRPGGQLTPAPVQATPAPAKPARQYTPAVARLLLPRPRLGWAAPWCARSCDHVPDHPPAGRCHGGHFPASSRSRGPAQ